MNEGGFDFSIPQAIEFNVNFPSWPPSPEAIAWLQSNYESIEVFPPEANFGGYLLFRVVAPVTYELVVSTQARVSKELSREGGVCESWGVLH